MKLYALKIVNILSKGLLDLTLWGSRVPLNDMPANERIKAATPNDPDEPYWPMAGAAHHWFRPSHLEPNSARRVRGRRFSRQDLNQVEFPNNNNQQQQQPLPQQQQRQQNFQQTRLGRGVVRAPGKLWDPLRGWVDVDVPAAARRQVWVKQQPIKKVPGGDDDEEGWPVGAVAKEFCADTSLHGVQYLGEGHWCERFDFFRCKIYV